MSLKHLFLLGAIVLCVVPSPLRAGLVNRWSFNNPAASAPAGTAFVDTVSGATATVVGIGATSSGTAVVLPGTNGTSQTSANVAASTIAAYLDLPNGIISSKTNLTVEIWATTITPKSQQRLFDFGRMNIAGVGGGAAGEVTNNSTTAPGSTSASDALDFIANLGTNISSQQIEAKLNGGGTVSLASSLATSAGTEYHYVFLFEDGAGAYGAAGGRFSWYRNGVFSSAIDLNFHLRDIEDVNNWLGRSQWTADYNANISFNEVRIYDVALTPAQISASLAAGPNTAFQAPVANADSATLHRGQKVRLPVLANDTGTPAPTTVAIVTPPSAGTATVGSDGTILYAQTTGSPSTDSFTYRATSAGGTSAPATVTLNFANGLRIPNTSLNVPSTPPPLAISVDPAFPKLAAFSQPVCIRSAPGDAARLWVCEKTGLLKLITDVNADPPVKVTFLDLPTWLASAANPRGTESVSTTSEQGLLGVAFHPNYASNRFFYVFYSAKVNSTGLIYERVSRFTTQAGNPNLADPASEVVLLNQLDAAGNHNGGDVHFGPDGYLYVSLGDGGNQNDSLGNAQKIDKDFFSAILRLDVDKKSGNPEPNAQPSAPTAIPRDGTGKAYYSIPADNPFVGATTFNGTSVTAANVRGEFWAVGLRNPWRMSFDSQTGELWCGHVGQDKYEGVLLIAKGGNYGWSFYEQEHNGPRFSAKPANFTYTHPVYEYPHAGVTISNPNYEGYSVTGGVVYRGSRFPSLAGAYLFADYGSGNIWSLVRNGSTPTITRIAGQTGIVAFGTDPTSGDVLMANINNGTLQRLTVGTPTGSYPATLSATGLFADLTDLSPAPGVLPYQTNLSFWSDFAVKRRWFVIPDAASKITWQAEGPWTYPSGMVWIKHFDLELTRSNPPVTGGTGPRKRLETRLLVKNAAGVYGVSYRWNDDGTEATLVPEGGADFDVPVTQNNAAYTQRWHIPSRSDCLACHNAQAGGSLSFNTRQTNLGNVINGFSGNQIDVLRNAGYFSNPPPSPNILPRYLRANETSFPLEARVRSYLAVNCAYCHQAGGSGPSWDGRPDLTLAQTGLVNGPADSALHAGDQLIVPNDLAHSIVYDRVAVTNGYTRMPPLASSEIDETDRALLQQWISGYLASHQTYVQWRQANFGDTTSAIGAPEADADGDGQTNYAEYLANTNPRNGSQRLQPTIAANGSQVTVSFNVPTNRSAMVETSTDLMNWTIWDVPGNGGVPQPGGLTMMTGVPTGPKQFFRVWLGEN